MTRPQPHIIADAKRAIRHVFIRNLEVLAQIGVYGHEQNKLQPVRINVDLAVEALIDLGDDLTKVVDYGLIEDKIRAINPLARLHRTQKSQIELDAILDKGAFDLRRILEFEPDFLSHGHDHDHEEEVTSLSFTADRPVVPERFQKWMGALLQLRGPDIFRSKGILAIDGAPRRYVYQGVHMMMDSDWGAPWKDGEARTSKLVFIGRNLDGENLKRGFEDCLK